jgi:8-oxo-dGTP pyrophosphatase MutT (NUDIX family)
MMSDTLRMRDGVIVVVVNLLGDVLAGWRMGSNPPQWQLPQGGRDGDDPVTAAYRELGEEVGLLGVLPQTTSYVLPDHLRAANPRGFDGQTHTWVVFGYGKASLPDLTRATDREFSELRWADMDWLVMHTAEFRKESYRAATPMLASLILGRTLG